MKSVLAVAAACAFAMLAGSPPADAGTITFGTNNSSTHQSLGKTYIEGQYRFVNELELDRWPNGSVNDSDPTGSTGLFINYRNTTTTMTKVGGGPFDLISMDVDDVYGDGVLTGLLDYEYAFAGGGGGSGSFLVDDVPGFSTILLSLANLSYFSFTPSRSLDWVQFDNVRVSGQLVPIPATLPLFMSALAALGWIAHRRKTNAAR
jgi:hypothetical protein